MARILKAHGLPPVPQRPTSWQTFLSAHKEAIAGADFFTTEVLDVGAAWSRCTRLVAIFPGLEAKLGN